MSRRPEPVVPICCHGVFDDSLDVLLAGFKRDGHAHGGYVDVEIRLGSASMWPVVSFEGNDMALPNQRVVRGGLLLFPWEGPSSS